MANTNYLKNVVENKLKEIFCKINMLEILDFSTVPEVFQGLEPDLICYDKIKNILHIGEITVSGFLGSNRGNFHIGGARKVTESFAKAFIYQTNRDNIIKGINSILYKNIKGIINHFIIPEGSKFIESIGWRNKLFGCNIIYLEKIKLPENIKNEMISILIQSRNEK